VVKYPLHFLAISFVHWGAIYPPAVLNYVVPCRAYDMMGSPDEVAVPLSSGMAQAGRGTDRFHVHEVFDPGIPDACRTRSAVLCIAFLVFQNRRKEPKKGKKLLFNPSTGASLAVMCYIKLF
jgi:hypothetical protein